jgi:hypothetical protein
MGIEVKSCHIEKREDEQTDQEPATHLGFDNLTDRLCSRVDCAGTFTKASPAGHPIGSNLALDRESRL